MDVSELDPKVVTDSYKIRSKIRSKRVFNEV